MDRFARLRLGKPVFARDSGAKAPTAWFTTDPAVDAAIRARFGDLYRALAAAPPDAAALDGEGHLAAAVIVFDQFPRNLFRGSAQAFATDPLALAFARDAVERGLDRGQGDHQRQFLYMPPEEARFLATEAWPGHKP